MAKVLYAWELGGNLGHIGPFLPLARFLIKDGHDLMFSVRDCSACSRLLPPEWCWVQAPTYTRRDLQGSPLNYAGILSGQGYDDVNVLHGLVHAWRNIMCMHGTELIIADHAPTAILAARTLGIPVVLFCSGFYAPPQEDPLPAMRSWQPAQEQQLRAIDTAVLGVVNKVLNKYDEPPLSRLADLFDVAENALLTWPELDHYKNRKKGRYWGGLVQSAGTAWPGWPEVSGPRIYTYLRADHPHYRRTLQALADSGLPVVGFLPDLPLSARLPNTFRISREPIDLKRACGEADLAVLYGGAATLQAFLLSGKPILALPTQLEQYLSALRVQEMGAGLLESPEQPEPDIAGRIQNLISNPRYALAAQNFSQRYADAGDVAERLYARIQSLLK